MKGLQIAVILLVLCISIVELKTCKTCKFENGACSGETVDCEDETDKCVTMTCTKPRFTKTMGCMSAAQFQDQASFIHCSMDQTNE